MADHKVSVKVFTAPENNPPEGWTSEPPPTHRLEGAVLEAEFGPANEDGIYAPHVEA